MQSVSSFHWRSSGGGSDAGFNTFNKAMDIALDMAAVADQRDGALSGMPTGIRALVDSSMGGLQPSDLIVRPGMGKTSFW